jgi:hypothetical protein
MSAPGRILRLSVPRYSIVCVACIAFSLLFAVPAAVAQTLQGRVVETGSNLPIDGASIQLVTTDGQVVSATVADESGQFVVSASDGGEYRVRITHIGYRTADLGPVELRDGATTAVVLRLAANAIPLDALTIEAEALLPSLNRVGFYDRKKLGHGRFIDRHDIERRSPRRATDLLRGLPGVRLVRRQGGFDVALRAGGLVTFSVRADDVCYPPVFLDGIVVSHSKAAASDRLDLDSILPGDIEGIEVYSGPAQVPPQYGGAHSGCGVVLSWTRR